MSLQGKVYIPHYFNKQSVMYAATGIFTSFFGSNVHVGSLEVLPSHFLYGSLVLQIATQHSTSFRPLRNSRKHKAKKTEDMCPVKHRCKLRLEASGGAQGIFKSRGTTFDRKFKHTVFVPLC